jgi:two-component system, NtrC family, sensor kinase
MKKTTAILLCFFGCFLLHGQKITRTELRRIAESVTSDTTKLQALWQLSDDYLTDYLDSAQYYAEKGYLLARQTENTDWEAQFQFTLGKMYKQQGNYPRAIDYYLQSKNSWNKSGNDIGEANAELFIGEVYAYQGNCRMSFDYYHKAQEIYRNEGNEYGVASCLLKTAICHEKLLQIDSALFYLQQIEALELYRDDIERYLRGGILHTKGNCYAAKGDTNRAMEFYRQSLPYLRNNDDNRTVSQVMLSMATLFSRQQKTDSSLLYARQSLQMAKQDGFSLEVMHAADFLSDLFKARKKVDSAFAYLQISVDNKDSLFSREKIMAIQNKVSADEALRQELTARDQRLQNNIKVAALLTALLVIIIVALILWRNNKQKQKANALLQQQKREVQNALTELKAVQQQLIHAEKMASLGELTAGIAHEIQNPLNFITNFSEICVELLGEAKEELKSGNKEEAFLLLENLLQSLQKVSQHGNRADAIVKNMLQHSRKNTGERELADINAMVDDCLRLSYQALYNKDKSFTAILETHYDASIGYISMIPQDMGRVLLNLFNNAFYAVRAKARNEGKNFVPTVQVSTKKDGGKVEIRVWDNGTGIPEKVVEKIYQPFFTTKPSGEGTGLGLSMSYDIVTKVHGGQMAVNTRDGEYAEFVIEMPIH